jgi:hypothetical protein
MLQELLISSTEIIMAMSITMISWVYTQFRSILMLFKEKRQSSKCLRNFWIHFKFIWPHVMALCLIIWLPNKILKSTTTTCRRPSTMTSTSH